MARSTSEGVVCRDGGRLALVHCLLLRPSGEDLRIGSGVSSGEVGAGESAFVRLEGWALR